MGLAEERVNNEKLKVHFDEFSCILLILVQLLLLPKDCTKKRSHTLNSYPLTFLLYRLHAKQPQLENNPETEKTFKMKESSKRAKIFFVETLEEVRNCKMKNKRNNYKKVVPFFNNILPQECTLHLRL
jgi:hypothetical protein